MWKVESGKWKVESGIAGRVAPIIIGDVSALSLRSRLNMTDRKRNARTIYLSLRTIAELRSAQGDAEQKEKKGGMRFDQAFSFLLNAQPQ